MRDISENVYYDIWVRVKTHFGIFLEFHPPVWEIQEKEGYDETFCIY